jgi:hypothetical protein
VRVGTVLRDSVTSSAVIAALSVVVGLGTGHVAVGFGLGAGLLIGSTNGYLLVATLERKAPFALASVVRLILLSGVAVGVALLLGPQAWSVMIGVAAAQAVLVVAAVRQGVRA